MNMLRKQNINLNSREVIFLASQNKTENLGLCQFGNDDIPDWRTDYTGDMAIIDKQIKSLSEKDAELSKEVENVKKSVSDRNTKIATAITEKGVATEPTDSADVMAENIRKISSGENYGVAVKSSPYTHPCGYVTSIYGVLPTEMEVS